MMDCRVEPAMTRIYLAPSSSLECFLQHSDRLRRLVERFLDGVEHVVAVARLNRTFELLGLGLQLLVLERLAVGVAQRREPRWRDAGRAGGQPCDVALRLDQGDQRL